MSSRILNNAHKVTYLVKEYPEHTLEQIIALMQVPAIDINTALWYAVDRGWIEEPTPGSGEMKLLGQPKSWQFGELVDDIRDMLVMTFTELGKRESDMEENYLSNWTNGYSSHDVLIAIRSLIEDGELASYKLVDPVEPENVYTFYTLPANAVHQWGKGQFKVQPVGDEELAIEGEAGVEKAASE